MVPHWQLKGKAYRGPLGEAMLSLVWDPSALGMFSAGTGHSTCVVAFSTALNSLTAVLHTLVQKPSLSSASQVPQHHTPWALPSGVHPWDYSLPASMVTEILGCVVLVLAEFLALERQCHIAKWWLQDVPQQRAWCV